MDEKNNRRPRAQHGDRIQLSEEALQILKNYDTQLSEAFGNTVTVNHREKIIFLLSERNADLSQSELGKLRDKFFNEVKALKLAIAEIKSAKNEGKLVSIEEVLRKITAPQVIGKPLPKRPRAARSATNSDAISGEEKEPSKTKVIL